jgi:hypothetical protein
MVQNYLGKGFSFFVAVSMTFSSVVGLLSPAGSALATGPTTILSNGFENGFADWTLDPVTGKWNISTHEEHTGLKSARVKGPTGVNPDSITIATSTLGYQNLNLSFYYKVKRNLEKKDHVYVEWSKNGTDWHTVFDITNISKGAWIGTSTDLATDADNQANLQVRLRKLSLLIQVQQMILFLLPANIRTKYTRQATNT